MTPAPVLVRCAVCDEPTEWDGTTFTLCGRCKVPPDYGELPFAEPVDSGYSEKFWRAVCTPERDMAVYLDLCVNDDRGCHTGYVTGAAFIVSRECEPLMEIENFKAVCTLVDRHHLKIGKRVFPVLAYAEWSGNMKWDLAKLTARTAAQVANYLKKRGARCTAGWSRLYDAWANPRHKFAHYDFYERETD